MGIRHVLQPYKAYSRDPESQWDNLGRVLVDMDKQIVEYDADALPDLSEGARWTKKALMRHVCKRIPSLPGRINRLQEAERQEEEAKAKAAAAHKAASQKAATASTGSKKKKGKKKR